MNMENTGRLTLPTDVDMVDETIRLKNLLGADALRDCDGTTMPEELLNQNAKIYATYYTTRKDNNWAMQHPEEIQQEYLISDRVTAKGESLQNSSKSIRSTLRSAGGKSWTARQARSFPQTAGSTTARQARL